MIKRFFKDSAVYTIGTALTRGIQILMVPVYTRFLSTADYGVIDLFTIIASLFNVTVALEINQGFGRYYSDSATDEEKIAYSSTAFWFVIIANTGFFIFIFSFSEFFNSIFIKGNSPLSLFRIAMASTFAGGIFIFLQNQLRWYLKSKAFAVTGVIFTVVAYSITILLMTIFKMKAEAVFIGFLAGYTLAGILSYYHSYSNYKFKFDKAKLKHMLSFSIPLVPSSVGIVILLYVDRFAIKSMMTLSDVGVFGLSYRFAAIVTLVLSGFQIAIAPLIYQNYKDEETPKEIERIFRYFLAIVLSLIFAVSIFSKEALVIFTTPPYYGASQIIPVITIAVLLFSMNMFTPGLSLAKKTKIIAVINISAAALNVILNYLLIPIWGILGSGFATLISSILMFSLYMYYSQKYFYIPHDYKRIFYAAVLVIIFMATSLVIDSGIIENLVYRSIVKAIVLSVSVLVIIKLLIGFERFRLIITMVKGALILRIKEN